MQRKLYVAFMLFMCLAGSVTAQFVPQGFNYQGIIRDADGNPLANQTVSLLFAVRSGAPNGPVSYSERQVVNTNEHGLINLLIGQGGTIIQGAFNAINWGGSAKYLSVSLETSPNVFDDLGTTQLMSVPYALYALSSANGGGGGDDWGAQVVQTTAALTGNGTAANPLGLSSQGAMPGQVLKWNGTAWVPQNDNTVGGGSGTVTEVNTGTGLTGGPITSSGTISLSNTGVVAGTYGSGGEVPVITVDEQGRITTVTTVSIQGGGSITLIGGTGIDVQQNGNDYTLVNTGDTDPSDDVTTNSQAGGDLSGPFANLELNPEVVGTPELADNSVTGAKLNDMGAAVGQVLKWNGTIWQPQADNTGGGGGSTNLTAGPGISVTGTSPDFVITNTGDINPADDLTNVSQSGGDVTGPFANLQLKPDVIGTSELADNAVETANINNGAVTAPKLANMGAQNGQVLKWNGSAWSPSTDISGTANIIAGVAIDVIDNGNGSYVISNAGDIDPFDDITENSLAGGDLSGPFSNLQINPFSVTTLELANSAVATNNILNGAVTGAKLNNMSALNGQVLKWNGTTWAPAQDQVGVGDNWGNQVVQTNTSLTGNGTAGNQLGLAQQGASSGQVLKWNGSAWAPANDNDTGDDWGAQAVQTNASLSGDGTAGNQLGLAQQGASSGQVLKWNGSAWAPANDNDTGDDWGAQAVQTNASLSGDGTAGNQLGLAQQGASSGQVLKWNGSAWAPANDNDTGDDWGVQTVQTDGTLAGNGTVGNQLGLAQQGADAGQVLKWNGSAWAPGNDVSGGTGDNYSGGVGINITGTAPNFVINNAGDNDNDPLNEIQALSINGNELSLSNGGGMVMLPGGDNYSAGTGIDITGTAPNFTIVNTGDLSATNELQTLSLNGNDLSLSNGGGMVTLPGGNNYSAGTGIAITGTAPDFTIENTGDNDSDPANELQTLDLTGAVLTISGSNSMVDLSGLAGGGGLWMSAGDDIHNTNSGNVLVGTMAGNGARLQVEAANGPAGFFTAPSGPALITDEGFVGLNNDQPLTQLHVKGDGEIIRAEGDKAGITLSNGSAGYLGYMQLQDTLVAFGSTNPAFDVALTPGNMAALIANGTTGNIGIGTPNEGPAKLKVTHGDGGMILENPGGGHHWELWVDDGPGNLVLFNDQNGPLPAGFFAPNGLYTPSDRRLKKDITAVGSVLNQLRELQVVRYRLNQQDAQAMPSFGFLAQDVSARFPELVQTMKGRDGVEYMAVNYAGFAVLAVRAIQEQQKEILDLQMQQRDLEQRLRRLEQLVEDKK